MKTNVSPRAAFTLLEIMIVVAIIGMLASMAIPNFVRARANAQASACINNLRLIDAAKQQWALENHKSLNATVSSISIRPYLGRGNLGQFPTCPANGTYIVGNLNEIPSCTLSNGTPPHALP
jgi:prepilin-type N-terminal cleavage/methylation domain-containing protein